MRRHEQTPRQRLRQLSCWMVFYVLIYIVLVVKLVSLQQHHEHLLFVIYGICISTYILSRFVLAYYFDARRVRYDRGYLPSVTFGVPSKNEAAGIRSTIMAIMGSAYPKDKFDIIAVNDGSTDDTLAEMESARDAAEEMGIMMTVIDWAENRGKREGMAECIRRSNNDIVVFIDSDSLVEPQTTRELVKYFADPRVGAVTAHGHVANADTNLLTKMQSVKYYISFRTYKAAESLFGCVTCCSGCGAAYRRDSLLRVVEEWRTQRFLGSLCTFGDDRALTNLILREGLQTVYAPEAPVHTKVPDTWKIYMKQQMRWKKSWIRESLRASTFMWRRRNPIMVLSFYTGLILPFLAPIIVLWAIVVFPAMTQQLPWFYLSGLLVMGVIYGLYYRIYTHRSDWLVGTIATSLVAVVLIAQFPYAIVNIRDGRWGTR